jgi:7-cyano-7-deazaguanine synthase
LSDDKKTIVLVSGGLDSATTLWYCRHYDFEVVSTVHFQYGQSHAKELAHAQTLCEVGGFPKPEVIKVNFEYLRGSSALLPLGAFNQQDAAGTVQDQAGYAVSNTYVPGRNIVMLAMLGGIADARRIHYLAGGWNAVDFSGYPDCRPPFLNAMEGALRLGLRHPISILAPIVYMSKGDVIKFGQKLGAPLELTWSCYAGGEKPCMECPSCKVREKGFADAGISDPALADQSQQ